MTYAVWLTHLEPEPSPLWGDFAVDLARTARTGVPVVPGFVISAQAVQEYYLQPKLKSQIEKLLQEHDHAKPQLLAGVAKDIRSAISKKPLPPAWQQNIKPYLVELEHHLLLSKGSGMRIVLQPSNNLMAPQVAVVTSWDDFVSLFKSLLLPAFTPQALQKRLSQGHPVMPPALSVMVQAHPEAEASGTGQQYDPQQHDEHTIYLTAHYHESAHTAVQPDTYRYDRSTLIALSRSLGRHRFATSHAGDQRKPEQSGVPVLNERQQHYLARLVRKAQSAFTDPKCFSWVLTAGQIFITGAWPLMITKAAQPQADFRMFPLAFGSSLNLGAVSGVARIIHSAKDWERLTNGDIAVVGQLKRTDREHVLSARAIISEVGHATSPEAIVAVSLGIPGVGGVPFARQLIKDGQVITVDGMTGCIYEGQVASRKLPAEPPLAIPVTGTHVSISLPDPLHVSKSQLRGADGIGLLRGEFLLEMAGIHPQHVIDQGKAKEYGEILEDVIEQAARTAYPYPLRYQLHDVHPASIAGRALKPDRHEPNPKLGYRGAHRLLKEPELVTVELEAMARVMAKGLTTIEVVLPMVRSAKEARALEALIMQNWPETVEMPKVWVRCETPSLAISADELCKGNIAGVYFDVPALAQLISGLDDHNYQVAHHLDQADQSVMDALHYAITTCRAHGVRAALIAEDDELHAEVVADAVAAGATEVIVTGDEVAEVRMLIASIEQRLLVDHALEGHAEPTA
jgi:pyruvate,water dikinase